MVSVFGLLKRNTVIFKEIVGPPNTICSICIVCSQAGVSASPEPRCCQRFENHLGFWLTFSKLINAHKM